MSRYRVLDSEAMGEMGEWEMSQNVLLEVWMRGDSSCSRTRQPMAMFTNREVLIIQMLGILASVASISGAEPERLEGTEGFAGNSPSRPIILAQASVVLPKAMQTVETANTLHAKGVALSSGGNDYQAAILFDQAYTIRSNLLGRFNLKTVETLEQLANAIMAIHDDKRALSLYSELDSAIPTAYAGDVAREKGAEVADTLAAIYERQGKPAEGREQRKKAARLNGVAESEFDAVEKLGAELQKKFLDLPVSTGPDPFAGRILQEAAKQLTENPTLQTLAAGGNLVSRAKLKAGGYSEEEILQIEKSMQAHKNSVIEKLKRGEAPTPAELVPPSLPPPKNPAKPTQRQNLVQRQNGRRKLQQQIDAQDPALLKQLQELSYFGSDLTPDQWFEERWAEDNELFESGQPISAILSARKWNGRFALLPAPAEKSTATMAKVVLNLKGLLTDRELRLQKALAQANDPEVLKWRQGLWEAERSVLHESAKTNGLSKLNPTPEGGRQTMESAKRFRELRDLRIRLRTLGLVLPGTGRPDLIEPRSIQASLGETSGVLEFLRYGRDSGGTNRIEEWYGALTLTKDRVDWVSLGKAEEIDPLVTEYVGSLRSGTPPTPQRFVSLGTNLYQRLWIPLLPSLAGKTTVLLSPDGLLNTLNFSTLYSGAKFVGESVPIGYLTRAADMLAVQRPARGHLVEMWFNPNFDLHHGTEEEDSSLATLMMAALFKKSTESGRFSLRFSPLPGTKREAQSILQELRRISGLTVREHEGNEFTEDRFLRLQKPYILHIGTHAFYLPSAEQNDRLNPWSSELKAQLPMTRAGFAVSGANETIDHWLKKTTPSSRFDGVLSVFEICQMDLDGTWLVTLGACDTGVGEIVEGESVLSLKSAFIEAGAQNVLFTLWPIADAYAPAYLAAFYKESLIARDPLHGLATVQARELGLLRKGGNPDAIWTSAKLAGAFAVLVR